MKDNVIYKLSKSFALRIINYIITYTMTKRSSSYQSKFTEVVRALGPTSQKVYMLKVKLII